MSSFKLHGGLKKIGVCHGLLLLMQVVTSLCLPLEGYDGNTLLYTLPISLSATGMVDTPINFKGVTKTEFVSDAEGHYWLMDNLNSVPLPASVLLLGRCLMGLGLLDWRRKRS